MHLSDALTLDGMRRTRDGYLVADARAARTGIQIYAGYEVGRPELPFVRIYRPEDEVFARDSLATYAHKPITNDHPAEPVSAENWQHYAVGFIGDEVARDGEFVRIPLMLADADAIADLEAGKRELSAGYSCELDWTPGKTPQGEVYDAIQRGIRINHVALVDAGRAGSKCRIGDGRTPNGGGSTAPTKEDSRMTDRTLKTVTVDGLSIEVTDQGAQAIAKLQGQLADAQAKLAKAGDDHAKAIAAKDADIAKLQAQIDDLKAKVLTDADIDARVQQRADLIATAQKIVGNAIDHKGKSDADIRKAVVIAKLGEEAVKDKAPAYIDARFDILAEDAVKGDPIRAAMGDGVKASGITGAEKARQQYLDSLANGWKGEK